MMKKIILNLALFLTATTLTAQSQPFPNGGFENWNGSGATLLPDEFHSNKDGNTTAALGPQTAFQEGNNPHTGLYCVRIKTGKAPIIGTIVNGNLTTGYVNAPSMDKAEGYIGTTKHGSTSNVRRVDFTSRPDSLVGYFKYTPSGDPSEKAKVRIVLHKGHYYDPETPVNSNHPDSSINKVGEAIYVSENQTYATWTRFSVPVTYTSSDNPEYLLVNITSSENQETSTNGSELWIDDFEFIYNPVSTTCDAPTALVLAEANGKINASWTAPATAPSNGYLYAVKAQGTAPVAGDFVANATTSVSNITTTTGASPAALEAGQSYTVTVKAECGTEESTVIEKNITLLTLGVNTINGADFQVYMKGQQVIVDFSDVEITNGVISIIDLSGRKIATADLNNKSVNTISLPSHLNTGIYMYQIEGSGIIKTGKLAF